MTSARQYQKIPIILGIALCGACSWSGDSSDDTTNTKTAYTVPDTTADIDQWGTLTGRFIYAGSPPPPKPLEIPEYRKTECGQVMDESIVVDANNNGLANVVLYLRRSPDAPPMKVHPDYDGPAPVPVTIDVENCRYEPRVQLLRTPQTLIIRNKDEVGHGCYITPANHENTPAGPVIRGNTEFEHRFNAEERSPVLIWCGIHPWMDAWVVVRNSPYMAVTDANGRFTISNLPVGEHEFHVWHESCKIFPYVNIQGRRHAFDKGRWKVRINEGMNDVGEIAIDPATLK